MPNLQSFGAIKHYRDLILTVQDNRILWKKVAHILNKTRRDLRPWAVVDPINQKLEAQKYANQALVDTKLPDEIKALLKRGMSEEFGFVFN